VPSPVIAGAADTAAALAILPFCDIDEMLMCLTFHHAHKFISLWGRGSRTTGLSRIHCSQERLCDAASRHCHEGIKKWLRVEAGQPWRVLSPARWLNTRPVAPSAISRWAQHLHGIYPSVLSPMIRTLSFHLQGGILRPLNAGHRENQLPVG
jgi:hypothetical protein